MITLAFFDKKDFEIFNSDKISSNLSDVREIRKSIKERLLLINEDIEERMNDMGLYRHKDTEHIVSLLTPCVFNHGKVNWIGIRYGKHPDVIDSLNFNADKNDDIYGFQKHNCFQIDVCRTGIEMGIFHAVPNGSVDRMYCHQMLDREDEGFKRDLCDAIEGIIGYGFVWSIGSDGLSMDGFSSSSFSFDDVEGDVGEKFIEWYKKNDCEGRYSSLLCHYSRLDDRVESIVGIEDEIFKVVSRLKRLYDVICWK